jgi:hypothetical protein
MRNAVPAITPSISSSGTAQSLANTPGGILDASRGDPGVDEHVEYRPPDPREIELRRENLPQYNFVDALFNAYLLLSIMFLRMFVAEYGASSEGE